YPEGSDLPDHQIPDKQRCAGGAQVADTNVNGSGGLLVNSWFNVRIRTNCTGTALAPGRKLNFPTAGLSDAGFHLRPPPCLTAHVRACCRLDAPSFYPKHLNRLAGSARTLELHYQQSGQYKTQELGSFSSNISSR